MSTVEKTNPISQPSAGNPKHEALNPKQDEERRFENKAKAGLQPEVYALGALNPNI